MKCSMVYFYETAVQRGRDLASVGKRMLPGSDLIVPFALIGTNLPLQLGKVILFSPLVPTRVKKRGVFSGPPISHLRNHRSPPNLFRKPYPSLSTPSLPHTPSIQVIEQ